MRVLGTCGMVASPHYFATGAGLEALRRGGSAIDAAIATNAVLAVVTPTMCGIGGDLFALVYTARTGELLGLNGSGRAPAEATVERVRQRAGENRMPERGPLSVTVPGCVDAWARLHERYGRLPLPDLLRDAIRYARDGFPVNKALADRLESIAPVLHPETPARETFLPGGRAPQEGQILAQPRLARTLDAIAREGAAAYYCGSIGKELVRSLRAVEGLISLEDLAEHQAEWVKPLSLVYRDVTVYELPPNSQGMVALLMLNMVQHLPADLVQRGEAAYVHLLAETARLAYADRDAYLTDPAHMSIDTNSLLSNRYAAERAALIRDHASSQTHAGEPGDTAYLCTADAEGNLVSLIESNYMGIGSGVMAGETGVMLQNRGAWFSLDSSHPNVIAPRKRTMHTLMPAMAFRRDRPWLVFGTMGGSMQPQIHVQILTRLIDQGMDLDDAIDAPRFDAVCSVDSDGRPVLELEGRFPAEVIENLRRRGHGVRVVDPYSESKGYAQAIQLLDNRVYVGAADPRTDSLALGY